MTAPHQPSDLQAIVDMGSNGIRFSVSNLAAPTTRILPTLYQDRAGISLYDAQWPDGAAERQPIDQRTIEAAVATFVNFKRVCDDFRVPHENIRVLATEATRTAVNSEAFRTAIKDATGWTVTLLAKEEEGRLGAMGVASSFHEPRGLVMDMGGGSVQLSWMELDEYGEVKISSSVSLPYGAAALMKKIEVAERERSEKRKGLGKLVSGSDPVKKMQKELLDEVITTVHGLDIPEVAQKNGYELYLSGGGFRGWGYALMDAHPVSPYPIPIINGFNVSAKEFMNNEGVASHVSASSTGPDQSIFRISARRASQVPAVSLLVSTLQTALPSLTHVRFAQGGVREGALYSSLAPPVRAQHPLHTATAPTAPESASKLLSILRLAIPPEQFAYNCPDVIRANVIPAFINSLYQHSSLTKETRAAAGLRSTTTGSALAAAHGLAHEQRALLGLMLCERWGAEVASTDEDFKDRLQRLLSPRIVWWALYIARVGALLGDLYPAGRIPESEAKQRVSFKANLVGADIRLEVDFPGGKEDVDVNEKALKKIKQLGKKKKGWIGGKSGFGFKIHIEVSGGGAVGDDEDDED